ncbi:endoplasmic reticulum membrane-associated RNA degradation protein-like isoform X3 [Amblyomma americanum]
MSGGDIDETWHCRALKRLSPAIHCIRNVFAELPVDSFQRKAEFLRWTSAEADIQDCFQQLQSGDPCGPVLAVLRTTAILEHSLGNVLFGKNVQVPFLLKDILTADQLHEVFGPELMLLLQVIVGPPQSLNLRNIVWHGFVRPEEVDSRYAYLLICIILSLGEHINQHCNPEIHSQRQRKQFSLERHTAVLCDFDDLPFNEDRFLSALEGSSFVLPGRMQYWLTCVDLLKRASYAKCLMLALPQLECMLRVLYTKVNNCSHRLLTAEMVTFYTTLDEILAKEMEPGLQNAVRSTLGDPHFEMFLDIFSYLEGPRLRDKISHGEVNLETVTERLVHHIFHLAALTCSIELPGDANENSYITVLRKVSNNYRAHFHPSQLLRRKTVQAVDKLRCLKRNLEACDDITTEANKDKLDACISLLGKRWDIELRGDWDSSLLADVEFLATSIADSVLSSVFRPRRELMVVTLLRQMCDEACITLDHLNAMLASRAQGLSSRGLRSRQRENYKRFLECVPVLYDGIALTLWIICCCLQRINDTDRLDQFQFGKLLRILKAVVKFAENLHSLTSPTQNRWLESCKLCRESIALVLQYLKNDSTTLFLSLKHPIS